ncbi:hypothetical protein JJE66_26605 [Bradyrhizobium diazoefficiens]|uniref:hypothetical protein n=1 Tax=Bradyrhizobium diazoefficiens TaxID=1355477 RepID=UPI00190B9378|nr:hypothetical protein [Bradyrhizobium diazoefficiens]MBK3664785.1 hypothetical protein [Bradyrhizobium diazoefficiens]
MKGEQLLAHVDCVTVSDGSVQIKLNDDSISKGEINVPWAAKPRERAEVLQAAGDVKSDPKLLKSIIRAHAWLAALSSGNHASIEELAGSANYNPKVIRQSLRLAYLSPEMLTAVLRGESSVSLSKIPKLLPLAWCEQRKSLG